MKTRKRRIGIWQWGVALVLVLGLTGPGHQAFAAGGTWTTKAPMPTARYGAAAGVISGKLYVASGAVMYNYPPFPMFHNLEVYDPDTDTWTTKAPIPIAIYGAAAGVIGDRLLVAGGQNYYGDQATLQVYDPATDTWTTKAPMPSPTVAAAFGVINGKLYVAGGLSYPFYTNSLNIYDPATDNWTTKAPIPTARQFPEGGVINGILYVVGGCDTSGSPLNTVEAYDPATDTWTTKAPMPTARWSIGAGAINGILYAVGGYDGNRIFATAEAYNPITDTWTDQTSMQLAVGLPAFGVIGGKLYCAGGSLDGTSINFTNFLQAFTPQAPPVANAGENKKITSDLLSSTIIQGTASDPDNDTLTYRWLEGVAVLADWQPGGSNGEAYLNLNSVTLAVGAHTLTLVVSDGKETASDDMILTIDNSAPHAAPSGGGTYEIGSEVVLGGQVSDFDGDTLDYAWKEGTTTFYSGSILASPGGYPVTLTSYSLSGLGLGTHTITLEVKDGFNPAVSSDIAVKIQDTQAPKLAPTANQGILWPPNHRMVDIVINANAGDNSGSLTLSATVASNEPIEGLGDGDMAPDWTDPVINQSAGLIFLKLRAERSGSGEGRVYTVTVTATDASGNSTTAPVRVIVPHDQRKR